MKLGTLKHRDKRDGELVVVSRDTRTAVKALTIAPNLREAIERWNETEPQLRALYEQLNRGELAEAFPVDLAQFHAPLPRSFGWLDGSAYLQHVKLVRKARNAEFPPNLYTDPLMYQGGSDSFLAPTDDIPLIDEKHGVDFEGEVAVITDDVPMCVSAEEAASHIKLILLVNDVSLRGLIPEELAKGFGFLISKPSTAFAPFAVTPDELGSDWRESRVHLPLQVSYNGTFFGDADAGAAMHFSFAQLMAHICQTRSLIAGTILGSGTVSNEDTARGSSCLAEKRMLEKINTGNISTPFMKVGDSIEIEMRDASGISIFGKISQKVVKHAS